MKTSFKSVLIIGLISLMSCKNEKAINEDLEMTHPETEVSGIESESTTPAPTNSLTINSKNIQDVVNEFKVDPYAAVEKYGGKEVTVTVGIGPKNPYNYETHLYISNSNFHGLPIMNYDHELRLNMDTKSLNLQPYIQLNDGDVSPIYGNDQLGSNDNWYIVFNKKKDVVLTGSDNSTNLIVGYIRMKSSNASQDNLQDIQERLGQDNPGLLSDLKSGNLYYTSFPMGKYDRSSYLLPCEYTFKGTMSKDVRENTSNYGITKIDMTLVGPKLIDTKWFIDKQKFFNKQVK